MLKGVLHPWPILWLFMHVSQKITKQWWQVGCVSYRYHIKEPNLLLWNFTNSSGYWFMTQNKENIDFSTFFLLFFNCYFTTMVSNKVKLWFFSSFEHFDQIHRILSKVALFFKKMHKIFQNKAQVCSSPLMLVLLVNMANTFWRWWLWYLKYVQFLTKSFLVTSPLRYRFLVKTSIHK